MGGNLDLRDLFLSADGRITRTPFAIAAIILLLVFGLYQSVDSSTLHWVTGWLIYPVLVFLSVCVLSKRLHDRGKSGWFALPIVLAMISVFSPPLGFFDFFWGCVLAWAVIELGLMPGEQGANRFGRRKVA